MQSVVIKNFGGSIENIGYQFGYPIEVTIWVLRKTSFTKVISNRNNEQPNLQVFSFNKAYNKG